MNLGNSKRSFKWRMEQNSYKRHCVSRIDLGYCFGRPDGGDRREAGDGESGTPPDKLEPEDDQWGKAVRVRALCGGGETHPSPMTVI